MDSLEGEFQPWKFVCACRALAGGEVRVVRPYVVKSHILTTRRKQNRAMAVFAGSLTVSTAVFATKNTSRRVWNFYRASLCLDGEKLVSCAYFDEGVDGRAKGRRWRVLFLNVDRMHL